MRYLSFDASETLLFAARKVRMVELGQVKALISTSAAANHWDLPESV